MLRKNYKRKKRSRKGRKKNAHLKEKNLLKLLWRLIKHCKKRKKTF